MKIIYYRVRFPAPDTHLFHVEARFPTGGRQAVDLRLPVWTPGSYLIREYERHVQDLACRDEKKRPRDVRKIDKATWRVDTKGTTELVVTYRVYANELTVRTAHLDATHAFWNSACLFMYIDELAATPIRLTIDVPAGWRVATGLERDRGGVFSAADYDTLVDSPVEVGPHRSIEFKVAGKPHAIAVWGRPAPGPFDLERLATDVKTIVAAHGRFFGGLPYERYAFLLHLAAGGHGGLEHRNSATLLASPFAFTTANQYRDLLELVSHEFFHLWNVKRIHPEALGPFDYQREAYTRSLWVVEGWTSYYDRLALSRGGLVPAKRYLEKLGEELTKLAGTPGRHRQSLEEASFDAWVKHYRPDENSVNSSVSYYLKGSLAALVFDLEIRRRSRGKRSLDDAMRALWKEHGDRGYRDEAVQPLVEKATGLDLGALFDAVVHGRGELPLDRALGGVGLRLEHATPSGAERTRALLGATLRQEGDRLRVLEVLAGGPAEEAGLYAGDQLIACDGWRVDEGSLRDRLSERKAGERVRLTVFRRDELHGVEVALGEAATQKVTVRPVKKAARATRAAFKAWLGQPLES